MQPFSTTHHILSTLNSNPSSLTSGSAVPEIEQAKSLSGDKWKQIEEILCKSENEIGNSLIHLPAIRAFRKRDTIDRQAIIKACIYKQKNTKSWLQMKQSGKFPDYATVINPYIRDIWGQTFIEGIPTLKKCCELLGEDDGEWFRKYLQSCWKPFKNRKNSVSPKLDFIPIVPLPANYPLYPLYPQPRQTIPPIVPMHNPIPHAKSDHSLEPSKPDPIKTKVKQIELLSYEESDLPEQIKFLSYEESDLLEGILRKSEEDIRESSPDISITRLLNRVINRREIFDICLHKTKYNKSWRSLRRVFTYDDAVIIPYIRKIWGRTFTEGKPTLEKCCELLSPQNQSLFREFLDSCENYDSERGFCTEAEEIDISLLEEHNPMHIDFSQTHSYIHSHQPTPSIEEAMNHDLLSMHHTPLLPSTIQPSSIIPPQQHNNEDTPSLTLAEEEQIAFEFQNPTEFLDELGHLDDLLLFSSSLDKERMFSEFLNSL